MLTRYWIEFDLQGEENHPTYLNMGVGVTDYNIDMALDRVQNRMFPGKSLPKITTIQEGIDIRTLDPNHILPNVGIVVNRGIWFPNLGL